MMRRTFLSMLAIAFVALFAANTERAVAQQDPFCCTYTINVIGLPATCFPFDVETDWGGILQTFTVPGNGLYVDNIPNCPPFPALPFTSIAINFPPGCAYTPTWTVNTSCCVQIIIV